VAFLQHKRNDMKKDFPLPTRRGELCSPANQKRDDVDIFFCRKPQLPLFINRPGLFTSSQLQGPGFCGKIKYQTVYKRSDSYEMS